MLQKIRAEIDFYRRLIADPQTPKFAKWCLYLGLAYLASPLDLVPDFIPVLGHLDDFLIVGALLWIARILTPQTILARCRVAAENSISVGE